MNNKANYSTYNASFETDYESFPFIFDTTPDLCVPLPASITILTKAIEFLHWNLWCKQWHQQKTALYTPSNNNRLMWRSQLDFLYSYFFNSKRWLFGLGIIRHVFKKLWRWDTNEKEDMWQSTTGKRRKGLQRTRTQNFYKKMQH